MKKFFLLAVLILTVNSVNAQWEPDVRLTNDADTSMTSMSRDKSIDAEGNFVHVVWYDTRDGNMEIYYKRSTDQGLTWGNDIRLTNDTAQSKNPGIALSGNNLYLIFDDTRDSNREIYFKKSTDYGNTWGEDVRLTFDTSTSWAPSIEVNESNIHVVWADKRGGAIGNIFYKKSSDGGVTWSDDKALTNDPADSYNVSTSVFESNIYVVWNDTRSYSLGDIFYISSSDAGESWTKEMNITASFTTSWFPTIMSNGSDLYLIWSDSRAGGVELYYMHSTDKGDSWEEEMRLTNANYYSQWASLAVNCSNLYLVWQDSRSGNEEIYYKFSTDNGKTWSDDLLLSDNIATMSLRPNIVISDSIIHVIWTDMRDNPNGEIYYKRNPTGNIVEVEEDFLPSRNFNIYPNPADDFIYLDSELKQLRKIQVFSVLGEKVLETELSNRIDVSMLPSGMYYFMITSGKYIERKKFVIVR
ncbi:MAG: T9SS type A sorting domain-containing protein [bacterium]